MVDLIDYNPDVTQEKVTVFDSRLSAIREGTKNWMIDEDLVDFPIVSQLTHVTVRWKVSGVSSGRFTFVVRSSESYFVHCSHGKNVIFSNSYRGNVRLYYSCRRRCQIL